MKIRSENFKSWTDDKNIILDPKKKALGARNEVFKSCASRLWCAEGGTSFIFGWIVLIMEQPLPWFASPGKWLWCSYQLVQAFSETRDRIRVPTRNNSTRDINSIQTFPRRAQGFLGVQKKDLGNLFACIVDSSKSADINQMRDRTVFIGSAH